MRFAKMVSSARTAIAVSLLAVAALASTAGAVNLRSPQVAFDSTILQGYLTSIGESINVTSQQLDAQNFASNVSGNVDFTLMITLSGMYATNSIGVYNAGDASPTLFQLFPPGSTAGYSVTCKFSSTGVLKVILYDPNLNQIGGTTTYTGVTRDQFAFYIQNLGGTFYSQDYRNPGSVPQVLTFAGTGINIGDWWECFQDNPYHAPSSTFAGAVLLLQSVAPLPVPTNNKSWGALKTEYR